MGGKSAAQRSAEELRTIRNRCLRAVADNNLATLQAQLDRLTTQEMRWLRSDADILSGHIGERLQNLPPAMKVGDRDE